MPSYLCVNKECDAYDQMVTINNTRIILVGFKVVDINQDCPLCNQERESIKTDGYTTHIHGGENIAKL